MSEERTMITRMIEERKITVEEGLALLEALDGSKSAQAAGTAVTAVTPTPPPAPAPPSAPAPLHQEIQPLVSAHRTQGEAYWESKHDSFPTEYVEFATDNASIQYRTWDQDFTQVNVSAKMDKPTGSFDLHSWLQEAVTQSSDDERYRFNLKSDDLNGRQVELAVTIHVPQGQAYELFHMSATNGFIDVQHLRAETAGFTSANGNIIIHDLHVEQVNVTTINGLIKVSELLAESAQLKTTNGEIVAGGKLEKLECHTTNGSVHTDGVLAESINVHTQNGSIRTNSQFEQLTCRSQNGSIEIQLADASSDSSITADTHNGGIRIQFPAHSSGVYGELTVAHGRAACRLNGQQLVNKNDGDDADPCQTFRQDDEELTFIKASSFNGSIVVSDEV
ncbi:DUF4097 family beta strand repeat-containing protein [Paenibacillus sp. CF384]|uniref:DUF4097 family beta strand repeat-containing protein n=1 Tax=Paenibacillus sp. CF384 TaxID=1884382 RepID=UPI000897DEC9|nr:DUF4097 family beta strand repeat-containing protein [Paenibacillus sp. CF384]SDX25725.1 Putative adhesin [Paenibacillus sp. CF384]